MKGDTINGASSCKVGIARGIPKNLRGQLFRQGCSLRHEIQGNAVVAIAFPCRLGTIRKNMALVTTTMCTVVFGAWIDQFEIG